MNEGPYEKTRVVYGDVNQTILEELERSVVGETLVSIEIQLMEDRLRNIHLSIIYVKELGAYKALITFASREERDKIVKEEGGPLTYFYVEVRAWSIEETCQTRGVWVECFSIPPHA